MEPVPPPDPTAEPDGFVVVVDPGDRIHFLDWGGPVAGGRARASCSSTACRTRPGRGRRSPAGCGRSATSSRWTCAATACPTRRPRATTHDTLADDVVAVAEGSGLLEATGRPGRPRRSRVRGDRRGLGGGGDGRALRRARPRRRRLGVARGGDRGRCRRVPARPRRAARGDALDGGVPRRPAGVRPRDVGCRPAARRRGHGRRDACRQGRARDAAARARGERPGDVPIRPRRDARARRRRPVVALAAADDETGSRAAALAAASAARAAAGLGADPGRVVRARRAQPDAVPSRGGQRGDPVGRRRGR